LKDWLALARTERPLLDAQEFAVTPLTKVDAGEARALLWSDYAAEVSSTRGAEMGADEDTFASVSAGGLSMKYYAAKRGSKPSAGWNLFISMHGGGGTDAATNDAQWQNQIALVDGYAPVDAIWVAPRAPTDEWNMWFREHLDALFERLITNFVVFEGVDPDHVYLNGYSAGGDGAYQMGPRMADSWAGVGMSAGHPNDASQLSLRNTPFALHVGAEDTAYERDTIGEQWGQALDALALADSGGYPHQWQIHDGLGHWMNLADAVSIPFLQGYARNPVPTKVVWQQASTLRERFYWLSVAAADAKPGAEITASYAGSTIDLSGAKDVTTLTLHVSDAMLDLDQPLNVLQGGVSLFSGFVPRTVAVLQRSLLERGDPGLVFSGEVTVELQ
jgi:poly(3-hydroxybutyrate) depolymerase